MLFYLLRHADAETVAASDFERHLSERGQAEAQRIAQFCRRHEQHFGVVLTSPLIRAQETARPVAELAAQEPLVVRWAASGMHPHTALAELQAYAALPSVLLVGHEPDLSLLIAYLLGIENPHAVVVAKGSLTLLELSAFRPGTATLHFSLPCRLM